MNPSLASCSSDGYIRFGASKTESTLGVSILEHNLPKWLLEHLRMVIVSTEHKLLLITAKSPYTVLGEVSLLRPPHEQDEHLSNGDLDSSKPLTISR